MAASVLHSSHKQGVQYFLTLSWTNETGLVQNLNDELLMLKLIKDINGFVPSVQIVQYKNVWL